MADYANLVKRALARSRAGSGGAATQHRLSLPVPYETLRQNTIKQAQIDNHPFSQDGFDAAVLRHALRQPQIRAERVARGVDALGRKQRRLQR